MKPIKILHLENDPFDVELISSMLSEAGLNCVITAVETEAEYTAALERNSPDLILADYSLPSFNGLAALRFSLEKYPEIPFLLVSGSIGEEFAIESLKAGATDYILKTNLKRLIPAVKRALFERKELLRRQKAEEQVLRLQAAMEHSSDSVIITGADGTIEYANPAFLEVTGYRLDEVIGRKPHILKSGRQDEEFYRDLWQTITAGQTWRGIMINRKKDGSLYTEDSTISPIISANAEISGYVAIKRDITEILEIESRRHQEELLRRRLADIFLTCQDNRMYERVLELILDSLESADGLFGYFAENGDLVIPAGAGDVWEKCRGPDKDITFHQKNIPASWARAIGDRKGFFVNENISLPAGHSAIENVLVQPVYYQEEITGLLLAANKEAPYTQDDLRALADIGKYIAPILHARRQRDIQEKKRQRAEQYLQEYTENLELIVESRNRDLHQALDEAEKDQARLDAIIKSIPGGLVVMDISGAIMLMNDYAEMLLGVDFSKIKGSAFSELLPGLDLWREIAEIIAGEKERVLSFKLPGLKSAKERVIQARISVIYDARGNITGYVILLGDITHDQEIDRIKTDFISMAAHKFRTPLTSIQGFSEILLTEENISPGEKKKFLTYINKKAVDLASILKDLLDLSIIEAETTSDLRKTPCRVKDILANLLPGFQERYPKHDWRVDLSDESDEIFADRDKIEQALDYVLSNGADYSPLGGLIRIQGEPLDVHHYLISVADQGIGMTPQQVERIFDKFYRVDTSDAAVSGTGLGMTIVRNIIEAHGGKITVKSKLGQGTTVFLTLPAYKEQGEQE